MTLPWTIQELIPHSGEMVLVDEVVSHSEDAVVTRYTPRRGGLFNRADDSIPAWVGIEYMAQAIATFAGIEAKMAGRDIRLGFLLGTRHYHCNVTRFLPDQALTVRAERSIEDGNGLSVFNCSITGPDIHAEASINVFQPPDVDSFLRENV